MNLLQQIEAEQVEKLSAGKIYPDFRPGDTIKVLVKVVEGERERTQIFEGVVIGRKHRGLNSSFRIRKLSYGEGVERVFPLYSPNVVEIQVMRRGKVRRAKLYYLRNLTGKAARIKEKLAARGAAVPDMLPPDAPVAAAAAPAPEATK